VPFVRVHGNHDGPISNVPNDASIPPQEEDVTSRAEYMPDRQFRVCPYDPPHSIQLNEIYHSPLACQWHGRHIPAQAVMLCVWLCEFCGIVLLVVTASLKVSYRDNKQKYFRQPIIQVSLSKSPH